MAGKKATAVDIPSNNSPESANTESFQSWINVHSSAGAHETKSVLSSLVAGISNQPPILSSVSSFVFGRKQAVPVDNDSPELPSSLEELEDQFLMAQLNQHRRSSQTDDISSWISKQFALTIQSSAVSPEIGEGVDWGLSHLN